MKILVIDDSLYHQKAAEQTLGADHNLTVVGTHDEALRALDTWRNPHHAEDVKKILRDKGLPPTDDVARGIYLQEGKEDKEGWKAWCEAERQACAASYWDVVLSDLLMPAGKNAQGGDGMKFVGVEMPVGWSLAIHAALKGAKFVAVVTDMNHHHHPASAMLDGMNKVFALNGAKALFTNHVEMIGITGTEHTCTECNGTGKTDEGKYRCYGCTDGVAYSEKGKDWKKILDRLTGEPPEA